MRHLGALVLHFQDQFSVKDKPRNSIEMLERRKFPQLSKAIKTNRQNSGTSEFKAGLKAGLKFFITDFAKVCKGIYLVKHDDDKASEIDKFVTVFQLNYKKCIC